MSPLMKLVKHKLEVRILSRLLCVGGLIGSCLLFGCENTNTSHPKAARKMDIKKIYPYLVPEIYLQYQSKTPGLSKPIGNHVFIVLVEDEDGLVRNVTDADLNSSNLTVDQAHATALENLEALAKAGDIGTHCFHGGPGGKPFVLFGGHWTAATCLLLPELRSLVAKDIGSDRFYVSIPHRDAMLIFPQGDRAYRDEIRAMVKEKEGDGRKPLTFELFTLDKTGFAPFEEND